jgi:hypothetical protein
LTIPVPISVIIDNSRLAKESMLYHGLQNIPVHELTAVVAILPPDAEMMAYVKTGVEDAEGHGGTVRDVGWHVS